MLIYVCSSSHGFGHAARDVAVLQQLRRLRPNWQLVLSSRAPSALLRLLLGTAHAHGPTTPTRIGSTRVVLLSDDDARPIALGTWAPNPGSYCSIKITWSAADEDAEGASVDAHAMLGKTLLVTADGERVLANTSASADAEIMLDEPLVFGDQEDIKLRVTLVHLADASSVERDDLDEEARGRMILDNLRQNIAAEVRYE